MEIDREKILSGFGEDINLPKVGSKPINERIEPKPNPRMKIIRGLGLEKRMMDIALGVVEKRYENPMQMAIALRGYEQWCIEREIVSSYAALAYYLNVSKERMVKYAQDRTQHICYCLFDSKKQEVIYSANTEERVRNYLKSHFETTLYNNSVEYTKIYNSTFLYNNAENAKAENCENYRVCDPKELLERGDFSIVQSSVTFLEVLSPFFNSIELSTLTKAEEARNPSWHIFMAKNRFGKTTQYADQVHQTLTINNLIDDMSQDELVKAVETRPQS